MDGFITTFSHSEPDWLHVAFEGKVLSYRIGEDDELSLVNNYASPVTVRQMESDGEGVTWGWSYQSPLYRLAPTPSGAVEVMEMRQVGELDLLEDTTRIAVTEAGPVVFGSDRVWRWDPGSQAWVSSGLDTGMGIPVGEALYHDGAGLKGWLVYDDEEVGFTQVVLLDWPDAGAAAWAVIPWLNMERLGTIKDIHYIDGEEPSLMFVGVKGLMTVRADLPETIPVPSRPIIWSAGDLNMTGRGIEREYRQPAGRYRFGSPGRELYYPVRYQTRVIGMQDEWSEPSRFSDKDIGQLIHGNYRFEVRGLDPFGRPGPASGFDIRVHPPWYANWWVVSLALVVVIAGCVLFVKYSVRRMKIRQIELEGLVNERTLELQKANSVKDEFIANLSHEIRNPLNGVIGLIRQLKEEAVPSTGSVKALKSAADYLQLTVEEVLDFSKLETGKFSISKDSFDLEGIASGVIEIYRRQADEKGLVVDYAIWNPSGDFVVSDESKVQQVIGNLVNNAVKFTDAGKVLVEIGLLEAEDRSEIRIRVKDTGPGITEADQQRIFEKFYQVQGGDRPTPGTGLGLTLVKAYTEALGGQLEVISALGAGTEFLVTLPVETVSGCGTSDQDIIMDLGLTVIMVEDMEYNRLHLEQWLQANGCTVYSASDGLNGLELATRQACDVILLDWELPGINGYEISRRLRASSEFDQSTRIVAMTAYTGRDIQEKCRAAGMNAFLSKPLDPRLLIKELTRRFIAHAGNLARMDYKGDWQTHKQRWLDIFNTHRVAVEVAFAEGDVESVAKEAHKLLGHLRMIKTVRIGDHLLDLLTAAKADDLKGAGMEWELVDGMLDWLVLEFGYLEPDN